MRILVITNVWPPTVVGGYEIGCERQVAMLESRGHAVTVLTSAWKRSTAPGQSGVRRVLPLSFARPSITRRLVREIKSQRAAHRVLREVRPDVVYVCNMRYVSRSVLLIAQERSPVVYFVSDPWFAEGPLEDGWVAQWQRAQARPSLPARLVSLVPERIVRTRFGSLQLDHVQFASRALRTTALAEIAEVTHAGVIHWGVDVNEFAPRQRSDRAERFLFVGQLSPHKGAATALRAFLELCTAHPERDLHFTMAGVPASSAYDAELRSLADASGMGTHVTFAGMVDRHRMADVYADHDVLIFASEWDEPFSIALVEAMASGLAIVATMTGGTPEIATPEQNVLAFEAGNASACRRQMERLFDPELARALQVAARATVETRFTLDVMVDAIEAELRAAARCD